jgi:hypothetical protein
MHERAYHEYLELYAYFARGGMPRLSSAEFEAAAAEWKALAAKHPRLEKEERERLGLLKALLFRDKP